MNGVTVRFRFPETSGKTALGNEFRAYTDPIEVADVLVGAGSTADALDDNRPDGIEAAYTLTIPTGFTRSLRGALVQVPGDGAWYRIQGDPKPTPPGQLRFAHRRRNRVAKAVMGDG